MIVFFIGNVAFVMICFVCFFYAKAFEIVYDLTLSLALQDACRVGVWVVLIVNSYRGWGLTKFGVKSAFRWWNLVPCFWVVMGWYCPKPRSSKPIPHFFFTFTSIQLHLYLPSTFAILLFEASILQRYLSNEMFIIASHPCVNEHKMHIAHTYPSRSELLHICVQSINSPREALPQLSQALVELAARAQENAASRWAHTTRISRKARFVRRLRFAHTL